VSDTSSLVADSAHNPAHERIRAADQRMIAYCVECKRDRWFHFSHWRKRGNTRKAVYVCPQHRVEHIGDVVG